ncbi:MAG TPA: VanZ family protein [Terriglobales bacterium]|nr:VanZ family protein [Terriglobales bacterium]
MKTSDPNNFPWREWTAAILWLILIAIESTPWLSAQNTGHVLYQLLASFFGSINVSGVSAANAVLRKVGHVTGYGILSWLLFRAWRVTLGSYRGAAWALPWSVIAFFMTAAVASLDEWHQSFLPSRTGTIHDVYLDSASALAVQILLFAIFRKRRAGRVQEESTVTSGALSS